VALQLPEGFEEHLVHRVMQRVDVELDLRLREAIATVVQEQTRSMVPRLREEVESVVRHAVYEAVAQELEAPRCSPQRRTWSAPGLTMFVGVPRM
jgi:Arc/MetJ family transcription regulator